mmetsp:Transcript_38056/g.94137  ORF Transcript_38056/g.94137 Transcript_38056/m.94137 type:complete len:346 (+) Transcript_38056:1503-2540(+)
MHDLWSSLLSIANLSRSLRAAPGNTQISELGKLPDYMLSCSSIMESIVSDMLDFERIEAGQLKLTLAPLRVHELVTGAMATFLGTANLKGIQLDAPAPEGLAARAVLIADRLRLQQCMQNGMSNAINFTERGKSVRLRTAVELIEERPGWAQLTVSVQDEGIGLSESELSALGEDLMFTQVGRGQMQGNGGTGLGLPIVRELLRKHDGSLVLSSEGYGKGTRFAMRIACKIDGIIDPGLENPRALSAEPPIVKQRFPDDYRALHVEDDAFVRFTLPLQTFNLIGVAYEQVEDGTEALELVRAGQNFDCIIIDNQMPRMGGAETTQAARHGLHRATPWNDGRPIRM